MAAVAVVAVLGGIHPMGLLPAGSIDIDQVVALSVATVLATLGMQAVDAGTGWSMSTVTTAGTTR